MSTPKKIIDFWVTEVGPKGWYMGGDELDQMIIDRFGADYEAARDGKYADWHATAKGSLALLILLDQFPRNMFRNDPRAFETDAMARRIARKAIAADHPHQVSGDEGQFYFLPFAHAEDLDDQDFGITTLKKFRPDANDQVLHARAHREIINRHGRFPFRNNALSRVSSTEEVKFMADGAYMAVVEELRSWGSGAG